MKKLRVGSRESKLAVVQTNIVIDAIKQAHPEIEIELVTMKTTGDKILHKTLDKIGGKGLFVKELDEALMDKRVDICVHSYKDLPIEDNPGLPILAVSAREDPRDVLILPLGATEPDFSKPIGCSSLRRGLQVQALYPHWDCRPVRGNVLTRLKKLDAGEYGALILAAAGIKRLGLWDRVYKIFTVGEILPAAGQGVLAIQGRKGEDASFLSCIHDPQAWDTSLAEKAFIRTLDGGCSSPVAAYAVTQGEEITLYGMYVDAQNKIFKGEITGKRAEATQMGVRLAKQLKNQGRKGFVTLVGAGPGDPALLTVGGKEAIQAADTVLYDRLVGSEILSLIPSKAEKIDVGKNSGNHPVPQPEINELIFKHAQNGENVVRLKGGDPYLFGRGAEELELLKEHGIPFRVIPGVTSAIAVPAYAGIPITHRDYASSLHIITGHAKQGHTPQIAYKELVNLNGTLVFLMSVSALPQICEELLKAGMKPEMPAAVIENGTQPSQRKLVSTVGKIAEEVRREKIHPPAILLVGEVCAVSEDFDWTSYLPLWGVEILTASSRTTGGKLAKKLRQYGCRVSEFPCINMEPLNQPEEVWQRMREYPWIVFTSIFGAELFFTELVSRDIDIRGLAGVKFAAIGKETARVLTDRGILPAYVPEVYNARELAFGLAERVAPGEKVLLYRAQEGTPELTEVFDQKGVSYEEVPAYQTTYQNPDEFGFKKKLENKQFTAVTFTSASSVHAFAAAMGAIDYPEIQGICIGESTAKAASQYGIRVEISEEATIDSMVDLILTKWGKEYEYD